MVTEGQFGDSAFPEMPIVIEERRGQSFLASPWQIFRKWLTSRQIYPIYNLSIP